MKPDLTAYRKKLNALRDRLMRRMQGLAEEAMPEPRGDGNWSSPIDDLADVSSRKVDEALTFNLVENEESLMAAIEAGLTRLDHGAFGHCESCGKVISKERLEAVPYAADCITCARERQNA